MIESISQKSQYYENSESKPIKHRKKWEFEETKKYYEFLLRYRSILQQTEKKQKQRIYNKMADHVGSRSTHQCRSHHQKVMKRHSSIDKFIEHFKKRMSALASSSKSPHKGHGGESNQKIKFRLINKTKKLKQSSGIDQNNKLEKQYEFKDQNQILKSLEIQKPNLTSSGKLNPLQGFQNYKKQQFSCGELLPQKTNDFYKISNDQMEQYWLTTYRALQNLNIDKKYLNDIYCNNEDMNDYLQYDYSRLPQLMHFMAQRTLDSNQYSGFCEMPSVNLTQQQFINYASYIFASIIQNDNLNFINPYIKQKYIEVTPKEIKIPYKKNQDYKIWVECVKVEALQENDLESSSEEIKVDMIREITTNVLKEFGVIRNKDTQEIKPYDISDVNIKSQIQIPKNQLSVPITLYNQSKREQKSLYTLPIPKYPAADLYPGPVQLPCKKDHQQIRRMQDQRINKLLPKTAPNEKDMEDLLNQKQIEKQQLFSEKLKDSYFSPSPFQQISRRQEFTNVEKLSKNFQHYSEFQEPRHHSNFLKYFHHGPQPSPQQYFSQSNNPHGLNGYHPGYQQLLQQQNQYPYEYIIPHDVQQSNFQRNQTIPNFPQRGKPN